MSNLDKIKLFSLANSMAEHHLDKVEKEFDVNLGRIQKKKFKKRNTIFNLTLNLGKKQILWLNTMKYFIALKNLSENLFLS